MNDFFAFLIKTHGEKMKKAEVPWAFSFKVKTHGVFAWGCGVWKILEQNAWAKRSPKQNALGLLHLDCHGLPEQIFLKKIEVQNLLKNHT